ncbi:MAG: retropepsin-like domain-containing protein [Lachnospiraceae bacterium]|nr:retropepsin-like domain-containing protein [Lachnospiraceae bacterium]
MSQTSWGALALMLRFQQLIRKSLHLVKFKLDSGSDFTTINQDDLYDLGYTLEFLQNCPIHASGASTASDGLKLQLRYITDVSIKLGDRELQGCRIYFSCDTNLRNLFGCDILKYFNWETNYDKGELRLTQRDSAPLLLPDEIPLQIYTFDTTS